MSSSTTQQGAYQVITTTASRRYEGESKKSELTSLADFAFKRRIWSTFWSFIPLSGTEDVSDAINEQIAQAGGEGATNLAVHVENCGMNYVPIINWLPIYPGCTVVTVTGSVVKLPTSLAPPTSPLAAAPFAAKTAAASAPTTPVVDRSTQSAERMRRRRRQAQSAE